MHYNYLKIIHFIDLFSFELRKVCLVVYINETARVLTGNIEICFVDVSEILNVNSYPCGQIHLQVKRH